MNPPILIGVAGGSCSGKTTLIRKVMSRIREHTDKSVADILLQDSYYIDQSAQFDHDGGKINFDHPDAIDFSLLAQHLKTLKTGASVEVPQYDFTTHQRKPITYTLEPKKIIFLDGLLILNSAETFQHLDHKFYIECPESLRLERRIQRDTVERGRTKKGIVEQFQKQVAPMHDLFVEPSKKNAEKIISQKKAPQFTEELFQICKNYY